MVMDALRGYLQLASGVTEMSRQRATAMAKAMLSSPEATRDQVSALANDLVETSKENRDAVASLVKYEVDRGLGRLGFANAEEVADLTGRVRSLESEVRELRQAASAAVVVPGKVSGPTASAAKAARKPAPRRTTPSGRKRAVAKPDAGDNSA
jgi:polyhydroxyalkanoate synthesis regulator phasin